MKISDLGEFGLIDRIRKAFPGHSAKAPVGIGDDAAALFLSPSAALLATMDMLIEGVHFDLATTDMVSLGWKAAAVNLSDIAAMGGAPRFCLVGLGLPEAIPVESVQAFYRGFRRITRKQGALLVGGDTCRSTRGITISVTVLGEAARGQVITRSKARPGDRIFVTGTLGDSGAGLEILRSRSRGRGQGPGRAKLIARHLRPVPRVAWGAKLGRSGCVSAMIDVSDGLSSDLGHLCEESGVGAEVRADQVPLSPALRAARGLERSALDYALDGGEDYELLFTVPARRIEAFRRLGVPATEIGRIAKGRGMKLVTPEGMRRPLVASGYDHFRKRGPAKGVRR